LLTTPIGALLVAARRFASRQRDSSSICFRKPPYDFAKSPNFSFRITTGNQQVGGVPQRAQAALRRSPGDRFLKFLQKCFSTGPS